MLTGHLQQSVGSARRHSTPMAALRTSNSSIFRPSLAHAQARSFWWRRGYEYNSKIDPLFYRFARFRTLKTRAKLIDKIRRRERWDLGDLQHSFSPSKQSRSASHTGRSKWYPRKDDDLEPHRAAAREEPEDDGFELSQREKQWKDHMEAMRQRIEQDPYEAVFGQRFEPFWRPLIPTWIRHDIGLEDHQPSTEASSVKVNKEPTLNSKQNSGIQNEKAPYRPLQPAPARASKTDADVATPEGQLTEYSYKKNSLEADSDSPNGQVTNYSYAASSSWDSWTKKAKHVEWDSLSGEKRRYEYDPISNRMVQVFPSESEVKQVESVLRDRSKTSESPLMSHGWKTGLGDKPLPTASIIEAPVKTTKEDRKAIPVPTQARDNTKTSVYFPSLINTSVASNTPKSSAVAKVEKYPDTLTAADVRASVGQAHAERKAERTQATSDDTRAYRFGKADPQRSQWDQAELRVILDQELYDTTKKRLDLLKQESGSFHIEKIKREMTKLDGRAAELHEKLDALNAIGKAAASKLSDVEVKHPVGCNDLMMASLNKNAFASLDAHQKPSSPLQPSLDRMQSKELPPVEEPDDSAAHESTGEFGDYKTANVPRDWARQAELLQSDRVRRTRGPEDVTLQVEDDALRQSGEKMAEIMREKRSVEERVRGEYLGKRNMSPRWIDIMNSRKAAPDYKKAEQRAAVDARDAEKRAKLAKANAMLQAEIQEQKTRMNAHENLHAEESDVSNGSQRFLQDVNKSQRLQDKIKDLRKELDNTFKQSTLNSEMQVERMRDAERQLVTARQNDTGLERAERAKYVRKIKALRQELDTAFKQSSMNAEMQMDRIRELEKELDKARRSDKPVEVVQAEGDMSPNAMSFAKQSSKWYKQQASVQEKGIEELLQEPKSGDRTKSHSLVGHPQNPDKTRVTSSNCQDTQVSETESDINLDNALKEYEQKQPYTYKNEEGGAEVAQRKRGTGEAQTLSGPGDSLKTEQMTVNKLDLDGDVHGARTVDVDRPRLIPNEVAARSEPPESISPAKSAAADDITWEDPPVYKVLAYDSGNDMFSTATTSSNFTGNEAPIAIQDALSQLYQPARFVPHFAALQKQGFQVIYGTKDLLVFKKVQQLADEPPEEPPSLQDHGLVTSSPEATSINPPPLRNPIDGTSYFKPATDSFACPTGFVGDRWDNIVSTEGIAQSPSRVSPPSDPALSSALDEYESSKNIDYDFKHYPRVRRQERVFSGQRTAASGKQRGRREVRHHHEPSAAEIKEMKQRWKSWRSRFRWALGVGLGASAVAYGVGAAAERHRDQGLERWERILRESERREGRAAERWNINEGRWNK